MANCRSRHPPPRRLSLQLCLLSSPMLYTILQTSPFLPRNACCSSPLLRCAYTSRRTMIPTLDPNPASDPSDSRSLCPSRRRRVGDRADVELRKQRRKVDEADGGEMHRLPYPITSETHLSSYFPILLIPAYLSSRPHLARPRLPHLLFLSSHPHASPLPN